MSLTPLKAHSKEDDLDLLTMTLWQVLISQPLSHYGSSLIHISTLWIDLKNDVHGSVFLHHGAAFDKERMSLIIICLSTTPLWLSFGLEFLMLSNGPFFLPVILEVRLTCC